MEWYFQQRMARYGAEQGKKRAWLGDILHVFPLFLCPDLFSQLLFGSVPFITLNLYLDAFTQWETWYGGREVRLGSFLYCPVSA